MLIPILVTFAKEVFLGKLHGTYVKLCQQKQLKFENQTEFVGLCNMLDAIDIIVLKKDKEARHTKVSICVMQLQCPVAYNT